MSEAVYRVAVASRDGKRINVHLGHVENFYVYDVTPERAVFVERREVGGSNPDAKRTPMDDILQALADCQALFVAKIGGNRREVLDARGIEATSDYANQDIEPALVAYLQSKQK